MRILTLISAIFLSSEQLWGASDPLYEERSRLYNAAAHEVLDKIGLRLFEDDTAEQLAHILANTVEFEAQCSCSTFPETLPSSALEGFKAEIEAYLTTLFPPAPVAAPVATGMIEESKEAE